MSAFIPREILLGELDMRVPKTKDSRRLAVQLRRVPFHPTTIHRDVMGMRIPPMNKNHSTQAAVMTTAMRRV